MGSEVSIIGRYSKVGCMHGDYRPKSLEIGIVRERICHFHRKLPTIPRIVPNNTDLFRLYMKTPNILGMYHMILTSGC